MTKDIWHRKSDEELITASQHLSDYTEETQEIIRAELQRRRDMPEPAPTLRTAEDERSTTTPTTHDFFGSSRKTPLLMSQTQAVANRTIIIVGMVIAIIGVAVIIFSYIPELIASSMTQQEYQNARAVEGPIFLFGVAILFCGGVITAAGFLIKKSVPPHQQVQEIFLYHDGQQNGPYRMEAIMEWHKAGRLTENDRVCIKGSNQWVPVASFLGMNDSTLTSPASNTTSSLDELEKLASLREKGIVTEEEYQNKKRQILGI